MAWFNEVFAELNNRLEHLIQSSLPNECYSSPLFYENIHIEFVPNYIEIRDEYHWNHLNDPQPDTWNSYNKQFLMEIHELAKLQENYQDGFDVIITANEERYTLFNEQNIPLWIINETVPDPYNGYSYSSYPTYDLEHPAMMHMPNLFLLYLNTIQFIPWDYDVTLNYAAGALLHEYFHYFHLAHTSDPINIMNPSGSIDRISLTGCQVREMYRSLMSKNVRKYVECEDVLEYDLTLQDNETWTENMRIYGNVTVPSGYTLRIACQVYLQPHAYIIVQRGARLILEENAIIANGGICDDTDGTTKWSGIYVEGNSSISHIPEYADENYTLSPDDHGIVLIKNLATLRDAYNGINCRKYNAIWDQNYWGAYVHADGADFINNSTSFFLSQSDFPSLSLVENSTFLNGIRVIRNHGSNGVRIIGNTFQNDENALQSELFVPITSISAGMDVIDNSFYNATEAVSINNLNILTHPFLIKNNYFEGNYVGINAHLASNLFVENNEFVLNGFGVAIMGEGWADISNNLFNNNSTGAYLFNTDWQYIPLHCNLFKANTLGLEIVGKASGMQYYQNQNTEIDNYADIWIRPTDEGTLGQISNQGSSANPILNSFSLTNNDRHIKTVPFEGTVPFTYNAELNSNYNSVPQCYMGDPDCQDVENNFSVFFGPGSNDFDCGVIGINFEGGTPPNFLVETHTPGGVLSNLDELNPEVAGKIDAALTAGQLFLTPPESEAAATFQQLVKQSISEKDWSNSSAYLQQFYGESFLPIRYQLAVKAADYATAQNLLNDIATYPEYEEFASTQNEYLQVLQNAGYLPDSTTTQHLYKHANSDDPMAAYTRALLTLLYDEHFYPEEVEIGVTFNSYQSESSEKAKFSLYPNPVKDVLFFVSPKNIKFLTITDSKGKELFHTRTKAQIPLHIETRTWINGVYILSWQDTDGETHHAKIVKH